MLTNYNIVKYCVKYFVVLTVGTYVCNMSGHLINQKSDVDNLIGIALFDGLLIGSLLVLRTDLTKLVKNIKDNNSNE